MKRCLWTATVVLAVGSAACSDQLVESPESPSHAASAIGTPRRPVVGVDGRTNFAPVGGASLRLFGGGPSAAAVSGTSQCDQGALVEQTDEDGNPTGVFLPEGGLPADTYDEIVVPADAICVLIGVTVIHNVTALSHSQLFIYDSQIGEDLTGLDPYSVQLGDNSTVGGNMVVRDAGGGPFASCTVDGATITGDVRCVNNNPGSPIIRVEQGPVSIGGDVEFAGNFIPPGNVQLLLGADVGHNADVNKNTGGGTKDVIGNTVANTLTCKKNDLPFVGGPNTANKIKGQCF